MKIVGFEAGAQLRGQTRLGIVDGDEIVDLHAIDPALPTCLGEVLTRHKGDLTGLATISARAPASARMPLAGITYGLPIARPGKIVCLGLNYMEHVKEGPHRDNVPKYPTIFLRCQSSLVAHEGAIMRPRISEQLDYEAEMVLVIGRRAKHLTAANATDCIAGYSCFNEGSVREFQRHTSQWGMGKNFDATGGFGPWMVTADELPEAGKGLKIESRLNGRLMQSDNTDNMMFPVVETLVYLTQGMTLEPGDIVVTGTPSGVGHARKPPVWMKDGDAIEIAVEGIGTLRNVVKDEG